MNTRACCRCGAPAGAFEFRAPGGPAVKCLGCALLHRPMLKRSVAIAALIGTVLVAINQGDVLLRGAWSVTLLWKVPLTYAVPFVVATWSALVNNHVRPGRR